VQPWPAWSVPPGDLTHRGYDLLVRFGNYDRSLFSAQGLPLAAGCAAVSQTTIYADTDQRTLASGDALAHGLFPDCAMTIQSKPGGGNDAVFHTPPAHDPSAPPADLQPVLAATRERLLHTDETTAPLLRELQNILLDCQPAAAACTPERQPALHLDGQPGVVAGKGDHSLDIQGPLPTASSLSEDLLLEYADGMPSAQVGWGHADAAEIGRLLALHSVYFDLIHRTPQIARSDNGALLRHIAATLAQHVEGRAVEGAIGAPTDRLVVLVGHDTNLAALASMLGLHWHLDGREDDTPPGTELRFELWRTAAGAYEVRVHVAAQTLLQMRNLSDLSLSDPPASAALTPTGCNAATHACSWAAFEHLVHEPQ
jgi:4-phytase/acid phosphatase